MRSEGDSFQLKVDPEIESLYPENIRAVRAKIYQLYEDFGKNGNL
jgi:hypothetical protein